MDRDTHFMNISNMPLPSAKIIWCDFQMIRNWEKAVPVRPFWRFYWNPDPGAEVSDETKSCCLDKSFVLVIPPGVRVRQKLIHPCRSLFFHVDFERRVEERFKHLFTLPVSSSLEELIGRLLASGEKTCLIGEFIFSVFSRLPAEIWWTELRDSRIEKVCALMKAQPERVRSNRELAVEACFSENAFIRRFREVTGLPPQVYFRKLRLERASDLLAHSDQSIEEIAEACGFCDRHHMSRLFKKQFQISPGRFRAGRWMP